MKREILRFIGHQRFLRFGVRDRLIRRYFPPERVAPERFEVPFFGASYEGNLASYIDWCVYFYGAYERAEVELLQGLLRGMERPVALDIGANVGHHTLAFASASAIVHAFEPYPPVAATLEERVRTQRLANVQIHRIGLGNANSRQPYFAPDGSNLGIGSFVDEPGSGKAQAGILEIRAGDEYLAEIGVPRVDFIKIDVEGFERFVLEGLQRTIQAHRPVIAVEFSAQTAASFASEGEFRAMFPPGARIERMTSERPLLGVLNSPRVVLEPFDFRRTGGNLLVRA